MSIFMEVWPLVIGVILASWLHGFAEGKYLTARAGDSSFWKAAGAASFGAALALGGVLFLECILMVPGR
jgi:uncharacterized membrane protein YraQ (UPF0718 family)